MHPTGRPPFARLRDRARTHWEAVLASPGGAGRVARGAAAGAFAAMLPAFGLHLAVALGAALLPGRGGGRPASLSATRLPTPSSCPWPTSWGVGSSRSTRRSRAGCPSGSAGRCPWRRRRSPAAPCSARRRPRSRSSRCGGRCPGRADAAAVYRLRKKIEADPAKPALLLTGRGSYRIPAPGGLG